MRRTLNAGYLVTGLVFLGLAASWALHEWGVLGDAGFRWVVPLMLLGAGLIGLTASLSKGFGRTELATGPSYAESTEPVIDHSPATDQTFDADLASTLDDPEGNRS